MFYAASQSNHNRNITHDEVFVFPAKLKPLYEINYLCNVYCVVLEVMENIFSFKKNHKILFFRINWCRQKVIIRQTTTVSSSSPNKIPNDVCMSIKWSRSLMNKLMKLFSSLMLLYIEDMDANATLARIPKKKKKENHDAYTINDRWSEWININELLILYALYCLRSLKAKPCHATKVYYFQSKNICVCWSEGGGGGNSESNMLR